MSDIDTIREILDLCEDETELVVSEAFGSGGTERTGALGERGTGRDHVVDEKNRSLLGKREARRKDPAHRGGPLGALAAGQRATAPRSQKPVGSDRIPGPSSRLLCLISATSGLLLSITSPRCAQYGR